MTSLRSPRADTPFVRSGGLLRPDAFEFLQDIVNRLNGQTLVNGFVQTEIAGVTITIGQGDPNGVVEGSPPDLYLNLNGGAGSTFWVKESGSATDTGWVGK